MHSRVWQPLPLRRLFAILLVCVSAGAGASPRALLHQLAPRFVRTDLHGQRVDLAAFNGQVVVLTFWATWCAPCQVEIPHFIDWKSRYGNRGLEIVAISMDDSDAPVRSLSAEYRINYPVLMGDANLARLYGGVLGLPVTFLIDRHGKIASKFKGEADLGTMEKAVQRLLDDR